MWCRTEKASLLSDAGYIKPYISLYIQLNVAAFIKVYFSLILSFQRHKLVTDIQRKYFFIKVKLILYRPQIPGSLLFCRSGSLFCLQYIFWFGTNSSKSVFNLCEVPIGTTFLISEKTKSGSYCFFCPVHAGFPVHRVITQLDFVGVDPVPTVMKTNKDKKSIHL